MPDLPYKILMPPSSQEWTWEYRTSKGKRANGQHRWAALKSLIPSNHLLFWISKLVVTADNFKWLYRDDQVQDHYHNSQLLALCQVISYTFRSFKIHSREIRLPTCFCRMRPLDPDIRNKIVTCYPPSRKFSTQTHFKIIRDQESFHFKKIDTHPKAYKFPIGKTTASSSLQLTFNRCRLHQTWRIASLTEFLKMLWAGVRIDSLLRTTLMRKKMMMMMYQTSLLRNRRYSRLIADWIDLR